MRREKTNYIIQSVSHALDVLEQFSGEHDELGVTELSKRLKLHKNNVFRLLATLESRGYIEQNKATENYRLGIRCLQLGTDATSRTWACSGRRSRSSSRWPQTPVRRRSSPILRKACVVAARCRRSEAPVAHDVARRRGAAPALHRGRQGAAGASSPDADLREALTAGSAAVHRRAPSPTSRPCSSSSGRSPSVGHSVELGEHITEVHSIAVPIRDYTRNVVGSLAVSGPAYRMNSERIEKEIAPLMQKAGQELSEPTGLQGLSECRR